MALLYNVVDFKFNLIYNILIELLIIQENVR